MEKYYCRNCGIEVKRETKGVRKGKMVHVNSSGKTLGIKCPTPMTTKVKPIMVGE